MGSRRLAALLLAGSFAAGCSEAVGPGETGEGPPEAGPADGADGSAADVPPDVSDVPEDVPAPEPDPVPDAPSPEACALLPDESPCDDGDPCTLDDVCAGGLCIGGVNDPCDDEGPCRPGSCVAGKGCLYADAEDGSPCQVACFLDASCEAGSCVANAEAPVPCPEPDEPCLAAFACDPATGGCTVPIPKPAETPCDLDGNVCTLDACDGAGACLETGDVETCAVEGKGSPCWTWTCNVKTGCTQTSFVAGASCHDGNPCTVNDTCTVNDLGQKACLGTPVAVDDGNPCTDDACVDGAVLHTPFDGVPCSPDLPCAEAGICDSGTCKTTVECACEVDGDCPAPADKCLGVAFCDTSGPKAKCALKPGTAVKCPGVNAQCLASACDPSTGGCVPAPAEEGALCEDGDLCTLAEVCAGGTCGGGVPVNCKDDDPCTKDGCVADFGCTHFPINAPCSDDDACTLGDECAGGECVAGIPISCDDGNPCTLDECDASFGCVHGPDDGGACDDGNPCTTGDVCDAGACDGPAATDCDDGDPCTADGCDPAAGCVHSFHAGPCDDGDACTANEHCAVGDCGGGAGVNCEDANPCTDDGCSPVTGCLHVPNEEPCSDGDTCTVGDLCAGTICTSGAPLGCDDDNDCTTDLCSPELGCLHPGAPGGCNDGNACTAGDQCQASKCKGGLPSDCDDDNPCTTDGCDSSVGCLHAFHTSACDDGDVCTADDHCLLGDCADTVPFDCSDGEPCNGSETCVAFQGCAAGAPPVCDDGNPCTVDECQDGVGCVSETPPEEVCDGLDNDCDGAFDEEDVCPVGTLVGGVLPCNVSWILGNSPYQVTSPVLVQEGCSLTIEPGVIVRFERAVSSFERHYLQVNGTLLAQGQEDLPIVFTSAWPAPAKGDWGGLYLGTTATPATLAHVRFLYASGDTTAGANSALVLYSGGHLVQHAHFEEVFDAVEIAATGGSGGVTISASTFVEANVGVLVYTAPGVVKIEKSVFTGASTAVYVTSSFGTTTGTIDHNRFEGGGVVRCDGPSPNLVVQKNVLDGTKLWLLFKCAPAIHGNDLLAAPLALHLQEWNLPGDAPPAVDATGNYWGPAALEQMKALGLDADLDAIHDFRDDFTLGKVDYSGFLFAPASDAGP